MLKRIYDFFADSRRNRVIAIAIAAIGLGYTVFSTMRGTDSTLAAATASAQAAPAPASAAAVNPPAPPVTESIVIHQTTSGPNSPAFVLNPTIGTPASSTPTK